MKEPEIAIVAGVGQGLGASICRELWTEGYHIAAVARRPEILNTLAEEAKSAGQQLTPIACDLSDTDSILDAFEVISALDRSITAYIHNAGQFAMEEFLNMQAGTYEDIWRVTCLSAVHFSQLVLPRMVERRQGTLLFTGATAAVRGGARFAAFASAKFALRGLSQSLAREFGPQGIHVAHLVLDGIIDCDWTRERFGVDRDSALWSEEVAKNYRYLMAQHPSAWTQELDLRPSVEQF